MQTFKKLIFLLNSTERKHAALLLILVIIMAILDMIGVASILPFMTVLTNPGLIETNLILKNLFQASSVFGVSSIEQFLFTLGVLVLILLILSLSFKAFTTYILIKFVQMREYSIGKRLIEGYLYQPYSWYLNQNSADLGKNILSEVTEVIAKGIHPFILLIANSIVTISLVLLLFITDPKLALIVGSLLGLAYFSIYSIILVLTRIRSVSVRGKLLKIGKWSRSFFSIFFCTGNFGLETLSIS